MSKRKKKEVEESEEEPEEEEDFDYAMFVDEADYEDGEYEEDMDDSGERMYQEESAAEWFDE